MVLTQTEFDLVYNKALKAFAEACKREMMGAIYGMRRGQTKADRLWLWAYALTTWDNTDVSNNYLTEAQMLALVHKVQTDS